MDNTYPETTTIYSAVVAAQTGNLYLSPSHPPFILQPFGPLYYLVNAGIARVSNSQYDLVRTGSRLLTYFSFLFSASLIYLISKRLGFSSLNSTLAALMFLAQPDFLYWNATVRPDTFALMVMLVALFLAVDGDSGHAATDVLAGLFCGLAFLIKQPAIAAPVAIISVLLYSQRIKKATLFAISAAVPVGAVLAFLLSHGGAFLEQFSSVKLALWSTPQAIRFAIEKVFRISMIVPILVVAFGLKYALRRDVDSRLVAAFTLVNWATGFLGLLQVGSDVNYFLPGLAGCALLLPFAITAFQNTVCAKSAFELVTLTLGLVICVQLIFSGLVLSANLQRSGNSYDALRTFKILSDLPALTVHGRDPDLLDPFTSHDLELAGHWNSAPIIENVQGAKYDLVILGSMKDWRVINGFRGVSFFSPALVEALNENYSVHCTTRNSAVLQPRSRSVNINSSVLSTVLGQGQPCSSASGGAFPNLTIAPNTR